MRTREEKSFVVPIFYLSIENVTIRMVGKMESNKKTVENELVGGKQSSFEQGAEWIRVERLRVASI